MEAILKNKKIVTGKLAVLMCRIGIAVPVEEVQKDLQENVQSNIVEKSKMIYKKKAKK